jgi:hypothetical protein
MNPMSSSSKSLKTIEKTLNIDTVTLDESALVLLDECDFNEYKVIV